MSESRAVDIAVGEALRAGQPWRPLEVFASTYGADTRKLMRVATDAGPVTVATVRLYARIAARFGALAQAAR